MKHFLFIISYFFALSHAMASDCNELPQMIKSIDLMFKNRDDARASEMIKLKNLSNGCVQAKMWYNYFQGWDYKIKGDIDESFKQFRLSENLAIEIKDYDHRYRCKDMIYFLYYHLKDTSGMLRTFSEARELRKELNDSNEIAEYFELECYYYDLQNKTDSAFISLDSMEFYSKFTSDILLKFSVNEMRASQFVKIGDFNNAIENQEIFNENMKAAQFYRYYYQGIVELAYIYKEMGQLDKAILTLESVVPDLINSDFILSKDEIFGELYRLYEIKGDHSNALKYFKLYHDAVLTIANNSNISSVEKEIYLEQENKLKKIEAELAHKDKIESELIASSQKKEKYYLYALLTLVLIFTLYGFQKLKVTKRQKKIIESQRNTVEGAFRELEYKNKEITDSINYAKRIQYTLLAHDEFLSQNLHEHFVLFKPKDIVSGDFYWATTISNTGSKIFHEGVAGGTQNKAYQIPTDTFFLSVCDSTGHGVPGAFMSLLNISFLNEAISERNILSPNEIFDYVRERLVESVSQNGGKDGMDGILVSKSEDAIFYAAANNAPVLISDGKIKELNKDKMPVGYGERKQNFSLNEVRYEKGDILYLYTDGFADQFGGEKGKKYKYKQLNEFLVSISSLSMDEQKVKLDEEFHRWKGALEQVDDVCIIGIRL